MRRGVTSAGAVVIVAWATARAESEPCMPAAQLAGDRDLIAAVQTELESRGIPIRGTTGCGTVSAELAVGDDARVHIHIVDADGRRVERVAADAMGAATAIESWARRDVTDPLLAARGSTRVAAVIGRVPVEDVPPPVEPPAEVPVARRYVIGAGLDAGVSGDGAAWGGVRVHGCARAGRFCLGGMVRYAIDSEQAGDSLELQTSRTALDLTLTAGIPLRAGPLLLTPAVGLGQTAVTAARDVPEEQEREQATAIFTRAGISMDVHVAHRVVLVVDVAITYAPFANTRLGEMDGSDRQLAAVPAIGTWLGVGAAWEGPRAP